MISADETVKDIAIAHPLTTRVFGRHSIDFCCRGGIALRSACETKGLEVAGIVINRYRIDPGAVRAPSAPGDSPAPGADRKSVV